MTGYWLAFGADVVFQKCAELLRLRWGPIPFGLWLGIGLLCLALMFFFGIIFIRRMVVKHDLDHSRPVTDEAFFGAAHALADPTPIEGNKIDLLLNGDQTFPAMLEAIRSARVSVNFEAFIMRSGTVGTWFQEAFKQKAAEGIPVRIILDGFGSGPGLKNREVDELRAAGCHFTYFNPMKHWRVDRINTRTHRRILVVDGRVAFTGGLAFADEWMGGGTAENEWRDTHVRVEGPLVAKIQAAFHQHWVHCTDHVPEDTVEFPPLPAAGNLRGQVIATRSYTAAPLPLAQAVAISSAEKEISFANPYCTPSKYQVDLLTDAASRGVKVRLLLPGKRNNQPLTRTAGRRACGRLLKGGVKIYEYEPTMIHCKTMVVDGLFSMVGTSNLDSRSSQINEEIDITVYDEDFGRRMSEIFERDLLLSREYTLEDFENRGFLERFLEWVVVPFRSQL